MIRVKQATRKLKKIKNIHPGEGEEDIKEQAGYSNQQSALFKRAPVPLRPDQGLPVSSY